MNFRLFVLFMSSIALGFVAALYAALSIAPAPLAGSAVQPIAGQTYNLAGSGISSSAASFTLTSFTITQTGQKIQQADMSSTFYVTFEPGNKTRQEIASCTTVVQNSGGTATLSGCTRGLAPISPYTASSTLQFAHGGGTAVLVDPDSPQLFAQFAAKDNANTFTALNTYTVLPQSSVAPTTGNDLVNYSTLLATAISGAGTSTETTMGISVLAPYSVVGLGTASTSSGAPYVLQNKDATTTPGTLCTGGTVKCIVAASLGKISQSFLDLTAAFTVTGLWTFNTGGFIDNASSTFTGVVNLSNIFTSTNTGTSTIAGNLTIAKNASTTNLTISGTCAGCISGWATATTQYQISLGSTNSNTVVATCAAGKKVIGGGYDVSGATAPGSLCSGNNVCVNQSYPDTSSSWTIRLTCPSGGSCSGYATSTAICVNQ